jgi:hypothetical protein
VYTIKPVLSETPSSLGVPGVVVPEDCATVGVHGGDVAEPLVLRILIAKTVG